MTSPLRSSQLRRILVAYTVNRLGTWIGLIALMVAVFDHTHNALAVAAMLFAGQALPAFAVPAVVARVEASRRRRELSALYLFESLVTVSLAVVLWNFSLPAILVLVMLDGTAALAASALLRAEVARVARQEVERQPAVAAQAAAGHTDVEPGSSSPLAQEAERKANAALNVAFSVSFLLGPILGGVLVAETGASASLFVDAASFLLCGALLINLHPHVEVAEGDSVRARLRAAWQHINEAPSLRAILLVEAVAIVFLESVAPIEVSYAKATLHAGDKGLGLLMTTWGAGAVLGSLVFARLLRGSLGVMLSLGTFTVGLAYVGFAFAPSLALACVAALVGGVGNGIELPSLTSLVQELTPHRLHGQLMGAVESISALSLAIGLPLGGALVVLSSPRAGFFIVGAATTVTAAALLYLARRGPRHPDEHEKRIDVRALNDPVPREPAPK